MGVIKEEGLPWVTVGCMFLGQLSKSLTETGYQARNLVLLMEVGNQFTEIHFKESTVEDAKRTCLAGLAHYIRMSDEKQFPKCAEDWYRN